MIFSGFARNCFERRPASTGGINPARKPSSKVTFWPKLSQNAKPPHVWYVYWVADQFVLICSIFQFRRNRSYWTYPGSLTTPPLHESVRTEIGKQVSWILSISVKISTSKCDASHKHQHLKLCRWLGLSSNSQLKSPQFRLTITFRMTRITGTIWWHLRPTNWLRDFGPNVHIHSLGKPSSTKSDVSLHIV